MVGGFFSTLQLTCSVLETFIIEVFIAEVFIWDVFISQCSKGSSSSSLELEMVIMLCGEEGLSWMKMGDFLVLC